MNHENRVAVVTIHYDLLAAALSMPTGTEIVEVEDWSTHQAAQFKVRHPDLAEVADGDAIPEATLVVRTHATFETGWAKPEVADALKEAGLR